MRFGLTAYSILRGWINAPVLAVVMTLTALSCVHATQPSPVFPLNPSANHRYLVDSRNHPFFYLADTPWMIARMKPEEVDYYLNTRKNQGFTALQIIVTGFIDMQAYDGTRPFGPELDLAKPNEAYFKHVDDVIAKANKLGFQVTLAPLWSGCANEGWAGLVDGKPRPLNEGGVAKARAYGLWLGERYQRYNNIFWIMGGDHNPDQSFEAICAMASAIHEKAPHQLITAHNSSENSSAAFYDAQPWLSLNAVYSYRELQRETYKEWQRTTNVRPIFVIETGYELEANDIRPGTPYRIRRQAYSSVLNGALVGGAYGHRDIWPFRNGWRKSLSDDGAIQMALSRRFFTAMAWHTLEPDRSKDLVVEGRGVVEADDYVSVARSANKQLAALYLPTQRAITVNLGAFNKPVYATWFDPTSGSITMQQGSPMTNKGTTRLAPPGANAGGGNDWALVLKTRK